MGGFEPKLLSVSFIIIVIVIVITTLNKTLCNFLRKDQSKCGVTVTMLLLELNVSVHLLKLRESCCTVVAVCIRHMCTYGFKRYFHFT